MNKVLILILLILIPLGVVASDIHSFFPNHGKPSSQHDFEYFHPIQAVRDNARGWRLIENFAERQHIEGWENAYRNHYYYNNLHPANVDSLIYWNWDDEITDWYLTLGYHFSYDATGEFINNYNVSFTSDDTSRVFLDVVAVYNEQQHVTDIYSYSTLGDTSVEMEPESRVHICYDNGVISSIIQWRYYQNPSTYLRYDYTFDNQGRAVTETLLVSPDSLSWTNYEQRNYIYHPAEIMTGELYADMYSHDWFLDFATPNHLMIGMVSEYSTYEWSGNWDLIEHYMYSYNDNNEMIEQIEQTGYNVNYSRTIFSYDAIGNLFQSQVQLTGAMGEWQEPGERNTYTWEQFTHNADEGLSPLILNINLSPNPFRDKLQISVQTKDCSPIKVSVYNLKGQLVKALDLHLSSSAEWDGKDANNSVVMPGLYLIRANQSGKQVTKKLIRL